MRIAVDAMGGDQGPAVVIAGAIEGARAEKVGLALVGQLSIIERHLAGIDVAELDIEVVDATETIGMEEHAAQAARTKPQSSVSVGLREVKAGRSAALVSAGNSGAVLAAALLVLGRIPGVERPAIASFLPATTGRTLVLDLGAVTDPRPAHLVHFARMGSAYAQLTGNIASPKVGLLSNGEEASKGNRLIQEAHPLLAAMPDIHFYGNVEGKDITKGVVDVVVTDGFTGNVALKVAEGVGALIVESLRSELTATLPRKLAALMLKPALRKVASRLDYSETGGAALLGIDGVVIIAHGRSDAKAIGNAVRVACQTARNDVPGRIRQAIRSAAG